MDMKRDLSCKICGTREFFVPFRENQWYRNYRLNSAAGCIRCVTFLSWLTITKKLEPKNRMWFRFVASFINGREGLMTKFVPRENLYQAREICQNLHVKRDHDFPVATVETG